MLLPYTTLTYYGPAAAALVVEDAVVEAEISAIRQIKPSIDTGGVGIAEMRPWRGRYAAVEGSGVGTAELAAKRRVNVGLSVSIGGTLTQDDVTGAVLTAPVEGGLVLRDVLRLLLAQAAGSATGLEGVTPVFKSLDGSKDRIEASYLSGTRTITSLDPS